MASAARKLVVDAAYPDAPGLRVADASDSGPAPLVHGQQQRIAAAFAQPDRFRFRAVVVSLACLGCAGFWAAVIAAAVYVGQMPR